MQVGKGRRKSKKANKKRLARFINSDFIHTASDKLLNIPEKSLQNKLDSAESSENLQAILTSNQANFQKFTVRYCNKSGQKIAPISFETIRKLIAIHGKDGALRYLQATSLDSYAIEWLCTDSAALNKLMIHDMQGYFIYAASYIFHCGKETLLEQNISNKGNQLINFNRNKDKNNCSEFRNLPAEYLENYVLLQDKVKARENLFNLKNPILITEANELLRRFLGLARPELVANKIKFTCGSLSDVTHNEYLLKKFVSELKDAIRDIFLQHFKNVKNKEIKLQSLQYQISEADVAEIKNLLKGMSNFHKQPKIRGMSKKDSILFDLKDFAIGISQPDPLKDLDLTSNNLINFNNNFSRNNKTESKLLNNFKIKNKNKFNLKVKVKDESESESESKSEPEQKSEPTKEPVKFKLNLNLKRNQ